MPLLLPHSMLIFTSIGRGACLPLGVECSSLPLTLKSELGRGEGGWGTSLAQHFVTQLESA